MNTRENLLSVIKHKLYSISPKWWTSRHIHAFLWKEGYVLKKEEVHILLNQIIDRAFGEMPFYGIYDFEQKLDMYRCSPIEY